MYDVGRKVGHPLEGYYYLRSRGYEVLARYCLTHSFIDNNIYLTVEGPLCSKTEKLVTSFLETHPVTVYDNIVHLCDLLCTEEVITTIEKRMLDISNRKGVYSNFCYYFCSVLNLKV